MLITTAREAFESYNVMAFCLEAEQFVDDKLSNWYVRRNRRAVLEQATSWTRPATDKLAAYQTLYTVLMTLTKLIAPVMPFLTEAMYQNLAQRPSDPESVHLCDYPDGRRVADRRGAVGRHGRAAAAGVARRRRRGTRRRSRSASRWPSCPRSN